jgi:hypothetical protein
MDHAARVELHCHSALSDGELPPDRLAERLAAAGLVAASLTDHDTVDGLDAFRQVLARHGVGFIPGVELTTQFEGREAHLLAYGFDPAHPELLATLRSLRQAQPPRVHSIAGVIRQHGSVRGTTADSAAPAGRISTANAIALVHRAHGVAVLAHPLLLEGDPARLEEILARLKQDGLDGIEALYAPFPGEAR